jgi:hypothetical protein
MGQHLRGKLRTGRRIGVLFAAVFWPGLAQGTVIYEQPPSSPPGTAAFISNAFAVGPFAAFEAFDDVTLSRAATVTGVRWFGGLFPFVGRQFDPATDTAHFILRFSNDNGGLPSLVPFREENVVAGAVGTATPFVFEFSADPVPAVDLPGSQRVWISIVGNDPAFGVFLWTTAIVGGPAVSHIDDTFILQAPGAAFSLIGGIPEPSPLPLLSLGLIWLAGMAAKRFRRRESNHHMSRSRVPPASL